jgi:gas vesicle protein
MTAQAQENWTPRPDPTLLTTQQLLRELSSLREIFETRLAGMDKASNVLAETVNRTPTAIQTAVANLKEVYDERFSSLQQQLSDRGATVDERFSSIAKQFIERDVRTEQAATASASALAAALQAAKEAVFEQAQAAAKAADKTETSTSKQIDLLLSQIKAQGETFSDRLAELKERIDRGEGAGTGAAGQRNETRLNLASVVSLGLLALSVVTFIILYVVKK